MSDYISITDRIKKFMNTNEYKTIQLSNTTFNYLLCGSGKYTLVFLDGGLGTSESWFEYVEYFKSKYKILTFSFPSNLNTNSKQVFAIYELLNILDIQNPIFVGVSYGALIAQLFTKKFPYRVNGLILISGGGMTTVTKEKLKKLKLPFRLSMLIAKILPFKLVRKNIINKSIKNMSGNENDKGNKEVIKNAMNTLYADISKESLINMGNLLSNIFDSETCTANDFKQLDSNVLLIFPEKDFFPKESQDSLLSIMTNPDVVWIDDGSHGDPMFNKEYMERVSRFLDSNLH